MAWWLLPPPRKQTYDWAWLSSLGTVEAAGPLVSRLSGLPWASCPSPWLLSSHQPWGWALRRMTWDLPDPGFSFLRSRWTRTGACVYRRIVAGVEPPAPEPRAEGGPRAMRSGLRSWWAATAAVALPWAPSASGGRDRNKKTRDIQHFSFYGSRAYTWSVHLSHSQFKPGFFNMSSIGFWFSVTKSCLTLCKSADCGPPGSSVHGISQARVLEWAAVSFSRGSSPIIDTHCFLKKVPRMQCDPRFYSWQ